MSLSSTKSHQSMKSMLPRSGIISPGRAALPAGRNTGRLRCDNRLVDHLGAMVSTGLAPTGWLCSFFGARIGARRESVYGPESTAPEG